MIKAAVTGAGRMGLSIQRLADLRDDLNVIAVWKRGEDINTVVANADVIIDFSLPEATTDVVASAVGNELPLVCGVSGLDDAHMELLKRAARSIPVLYDRNMSVGIAVLEAAIRDVGATLGEGWDIEIDETHHVHKKDAPSGTALKLGAALREAAGIGDADIVYRSHREGEVPGDHAVIFASPTERLEFRHSVTTRDVFAEGALRAAIWLVGQPPGLYSMRDVLFGD